MLNFMYTGMLGDLVLRHKTRPELRCRIETSSENRDLPIEALSNSAVRRARMKLGRHADLPRLDIAASVRLDVMSMAMADYIARDISGWLQSGCSTDPADRPYRAFREVEPFLSVLYSLEEGRISDRKTLLH
ncbi:hypothetical protein GCM10020218_085490 [Dactylosporangium vinaceum]